MPEVPTWWLEWGLNLMTLRMQGTELTREPTGPSKLRERKQATKTGDIYLLSVITFLLTKREHPSLLEHIPVLYK